MNTQKITLMCVLLISLYLFSACASVYSVNPAEMVAAELAHSEGMGKYNDYVAIQRQIETGERNGTLSGTALTDLYARRSLVRAEAHAQFLGADKIYSRNLEKATGQAKTDLQVKYQKNKEYLDKTKPQ